MRRDKRTTAKWRVWPKEKKERQITAIAMEDRAISLLKESRKNRRDHVVNTWKGENNDERNEN